MEDRQIIVNFRFMVAVLFLVVILCVVIILLLAQQYFMGVKPAAIQSPLNNNQVVAPINEGTIDAQAKTYCAERVAACGKNCPTTTPEVDCLDAYYSQQAIANKDVSLCDYIKNQDGKTGCLDNIYWDKAIKDQSLEYCKKLSLAEQRQSCLDQVNYALAIKNPNQAKSYCAAIVASAMKSSCTKKFVK